MSAKKYGLIAILAVFSLLLTGCAFLNNGGDDSEVQYPVGIITPKPTLDLDVDDSKDENEDEEEVTLTPTDISETPTLEASVTPTASPNPMDDDDDTLPTTPVGENKIIVSSVTVTETTGGLSVHIEGMYPDSCTTGKYSWSTSGTQIIIDLGQKDEAITDCGSSDRTYTADVPINYTLNADQEYTIVVNEVESDPITVSE